MIDARASRSTPRGCAGIPGLARARRVTNSRWIGYAGSGRDGTCTNAPSAICRCSRHERRGIERDVAAQVTSPGPRIRAQRLRQAPARIPAPTATDDKLRTVPPFTNTSRGQLACPNMKGVSDSRETVASGRRTERRRGDREMA